MGRDSRPPYEDEEPSDDKMTFRKFQNLLFEMLDGELGNEDDDHDCYVDFVHTRRMLGYSAEKFISERFMDYNPDKNSVWLKTTRLIESGQAIDKTKLK